MNDTSAVLKLFGWAVLIIGVIGGLGGAFMGGGFPFFFSILLRPVAWARRDHPAAGSTASFLPALGGSFGTVAAQAGTTCTWATHLRKMRHPAPPWRENLPHLPPRK